MRGRIIKMIPEIEWIQNKELQNKVVATIEDALKTGG
ncbi:MAG TPA: phosphohydrolase, partial [Synergistetes bacterium]|nr:phosphohydrolase [Synergistota bacterium]